MYPKRVILDDARQLGIEVLPLDVQVSDRVYRVEPVGDGFGIRLALSDVAGISADEVDRIIQARPYLDLADFFLRTKVSRPVIERLISVGAFDSLHGISLGPMSLGSISLGPLSPGPISLGPVASAQSASITRRDLLLQLADLDQATKTTRSRASTGQLSLVAAIDPASSLVPTGLPEMTSAESVRAELEVLGLDASRHVVDFYSSLLDRLNVVRSKDLLTTRSQSHVLVAGVKVSTQTPPVRSGRRVVFLTMDDSTGPVDVAFFDSTSAQTLHQVFSGWLLVIRGVTRRTGPKGISIRGLQAWDLTQLYEVYQSEGLGAVLDLLAPEPEVKRYDQRAKSGTMKP
jgi:error-prone DNA polymerase